MLTYLAEFLKANPVALLFAVLWIGYLVGRTRIRGFEFGSISGVLFVDHTGRVGPELSEPELLDVSLESCRIVLLRKKIRKVAASLGAITARGGCFISKIERLGVDIPLQGDI